MKTSLHTKRQQGYLDFLSGIICLTIYEERDINFINISPEQAIVRSLLVHEITHLMDLYTTAWGIEYVFRKNCAYMGRGKPDYQQRLSVFMLNTAEIESHENLKKTHSEVSLNEASQINHALVYDQRFGSMIIVNYVADNKIIHQTPLSMLSLLEAHATSEEFLSRINDAKISTCNPIVGDKIIQQDFKNLLGDRELSEYSLLLFLTQLHFKEFLTFEQIPRLVSSLSRIALDFSAISCVSFGRFISDKFQNIEIGDNICLDLSRGMSRPIVFFKTILLMYDWLKTCSDEKRDVVLNTLKVEPSEAIVEFFNVIGIYYDNKINDVEFQSYLKFLLEEESSIPDGTYAKEITIGNRVLLTDSCLADCFFKISIPPILLGDDAELFLGNTVAKDHMVFVKNNLDIYTQLDSLYRENEHNKSHLPLGDGLDFFRAQQ